MQHTVGVLRGAAQAGGTEARHLANVAYAAACSCIGALFGVLFEALARAAERRLGEFNAQDLANMA